MRTFGNALRSIGIGVIALIVIYIIFTGGMGMLYASTLVWYVLAAVALVVVGQLCILKSGQSDFTTVAKNRNEKIYSIIGLSVILIPATIVIVGMLMNR